MFTKCMVSVTSGFRCDICGNYTCSVMFTFNDAVYSLNVWSFVSTALSMLNVWCTLKRVVMTTKAIRVYTILRVYNEPYNIEHWTAEIVVEKSSNTCSMFTKHWTCSGKEALLHNLGTNAFLRTELSVGQLKLCAHHTIETACISQQQH
jgi:hypothetical protein